MTEKLISGNRIAHARAAADILCIGSVLWDIIGRTPGAVPTGGDVPGKVTRAPGGVAFNIAQTLRQSGMKPALLSVVGRDQDGRDLIAACEALGLVVAYVLVSDDLPTDRYVAIEAAGGLVAAIADARTLEATGERILAPLSDGRLGSAAEPWAGLIALDGNLTPTVLTEIAASALFVRADLRVAPASPAKADRLRPLLRHPRVTLYLNLAEAATLCRKTFTTATDAARDLLLQGARRVLVTDGSREVCEATAENIITRRPPAVMVRRVTGAGDTFMAAHIAAEAAGAGAGEAIDTALAAAAAHVEDGLPR